MFNTSTFGYDPAAACNATFAAVIQGVLDSGTFRDGPDPSWSQTVVDAALGCRFSRDGALAQESFRLLVLWSIYGYRPSAIIAILALVGFGLGALWHCWQLFRTRCWIMSPILVGAGLELFGWSQRYAAHNDPTSYYIEQLATLTIAPAFISCSVYTLFQVMINYLDSRLLFGLRPKTMMWVWIAIDVATLVVQGVGGGLAGSAGDNRDMLETGSWIMFAGIVIQLVTAIGFTVIFLIYFRRIHRKYVVGKQGARPVSFRPPAPVGLFFWGGLIVEFLIILRGCYRTAELAGGFTSAIARDQTTLIVLDAVPMVVALLLLNIIHPQFTLPAEFWSGKASATALDGGRDSAGISMDSPGSSQAGSKRESV